MFDAVFQKQCGNYEYTDNIFSPSEWIVSGYKKVLTEAPFMTWLWNSLFSSVVSTAIVVFTSCLGGYIFGKFNFKGKNFLFVCVLITMMVPFQVTMIPTYIICSKLNILNSMSALIIPFMVSGFGIFLVSSICGKHSE